MRIQRRSRWAALCLTLGLCGGTAGATAITGGDYASWINATVAATQQSVTLGACGAPCTLGGFTFTAAVGSVGSGSIVVSGKSYSGLKTSTLSNTLIMSTPPGGETAIYMNLFNYNGGYSGGGSLGVTLSDSETFTMATSGIFWFATTAPITSVTITSNNQPLIAQLSYAQSVAATSGGGSGTGSPSPVPEPATILLVSGGALIFFGARRRWFSRQA